MGPSIEGDSSSGTKKKRERGHSRNISLDMYVQRHEKIQITIDEKVGKPVSIFATKFSNTIGAALETPFQCVVLSGRMCLVMPLPL